MYIATIPNRSSPPAILLRENYRAGGKVKTRTLGNVTHWPAEKVQSLRRVLRNETLVPVHEALAIERTLPHGHVVAVLGTLRRLGLERTLHSRPSRERALVVAMIVARILDPRSKLGKVVAATQRARRPLRGAHNIGLRVGKMLGRYKVGKHFVVTITEDACTYQRDTEKIKAEAALDGIYVVRTSVEAETLGTDQTVRAYKGLAVAERAFRSLKTVDLKVRPIYHRLADRVRAHVFLCMLAYYVEWHMREALAPILFDDDDKPAAEAARRSVVAPAQRSAKAQRKALTKRTEDDLPVHSFQTLLADLATMAKNHVRFGQDPGVTTTTFTQPTAVQQRALNLLGISPPCPAPRSAPADPHAP